jgi:hypothetical protein
MFPIRRDLHQSLGDGTEQQVVEFDGVLPDQRIEIVRQRKDDVEITSLEKLLLAGGDPALASLGLALRAVTITTGVERDGVFGIATTVSTGVLHTLVEMTTECGRAAPCDRTHDLQLLKSVVGAVQFWSRTRKTRFARSQRL